MSKRFWIDNGEIVDSGFFLSDKQNYVDVMNNLEDIASKWQHKCTDLEAKLAERDEQIWTLENQKLHAHNCLNQLKQQLAEKEKEIERLKHIERYDIGEMFLENAKLIIEKRQFAIEQLQRVKEEMHRGLEFDYDLDIWATEFIDTIINEIKGE